MGVSRGERGSKAATQLPSGSSASLPTQAIYCQGEDQNLRSIVKALLTTEAAKVNLRAFRTAVKRDMGENDVG